MSMATSATPVNPCSPPYTVTLQPPPPTALLVPNGFPTPPLPPNAPKHFLDAMRVRLAVFCDEQNCSVDAELDEDDPRSWQWIVYHGDEPVACIRLCPPPHAPHPNGYVDPDEEPYLKLQRFATLPSHRGKGLGRMLVDTSMQWAAEHAKEIGGSEWKGMVLVHAQVSVEKVWAKMGFVTDEKLGRWDEEGIEHLGMWRRVELSNET
jgi:predicted GNAT family N-acyltransferase